MYVDCGFTSYDYSMIHVHARLRLAEPTDACLFRAAPFDDATDDQGSSQSLGMLPLPACYAPCVARILNLFDEPARRLRLASMDPQQLQLSSPRLRQPLPRCS
jgi:hypothetical protein